jgi:hypothetical protein
MKQGVDKLVATVLTFLILVLPAALSARERRGSNLEITLKDGHYVMGELIAVKTDSLLLLSGKDESVDLARIRSIRIIRRSKAGRGALYGLLAGAVLTAMMAASGDQEDWQLAVGGTAFIISGPLIGLGAGALAGRDKTIHLEGKSDSDVKYALIYLNSKARIRDYK